MSRVVEILFIKQKLIEVISQDNRGSVVKDAGVRYGGPGSISAL